LGTFHLSVLGDFMSEIFKKPLRLRLHGGFVKPGEPFSFFLPEEHDQTILSEIRGQEGPAPATVAKKDARFGLSLGV
jgi:hypothetical protein